MKKSIKVASIILCLIILILLNTIFFRTEIEEKIKQTIYEKTDKSFDFDILESSWEEDFSDYCNANCSKSNTNCKAGATQPCYSPTQCDTEKWHIRTKSSANLECNYKISGITEENKRFIDEGENVNRYPRALDLRNDSIINVCCTSLTYPGETICKSSILVAQCKEGINYCGNKICDKNEDCKTCSHDCGSCEPKPHHSYYMCIRGAGDLVYNENKIILQEDMEEITTIHNNKKVDLHCQQLEVSAYDEVVFRMNQGSEGIIFRYDRGYENNLGEKQLTFENEYSAYNKICKFTDSENSFNCENLIIF